MPADRQDHWVSDLTTTSHQAAVLRMGQPRERVALDFCGPLLRFPQHRGIVGAVDHEDFLCPHSHTQAWSSRSPLDPGSRSRLFFLPPSYRGHSEPAAGQRHCQALPRESLFPNPFVSLPSLCLSLGQLAGRDLGPSFLWSPSSAHPSASGRETLVPPAPVGLPAQ